MAYIGTLDFERTLSGKWKLRHPFAYEHRGEAVIAPAGYVSDLITLCMEPAVLHDRAYDMGWSWWKCQVWLYRMLRAKGARRRLALFVVIGVAVAGR